jgi:hypothetical protein
MEPHFRKSLPERAGNASSSNPLISFFCTRHLITFLNEWFSIATNIHSPIAGESINLSINDNFVNPGFDTVGADQLTRMKHPPVRRRKNEHTTN